MQVYSNAFNFSSYLSADVDERTGQYGSIIRLATIYPEGPVENSRDIKIFFSMLDTTDSGYGLGWSISNTEFDSTTSRLRLLSGESFLTDALPPINSYMRIRDRKLKDIAVRRHDANTLHVIYKDGMIDVLRRPRPSDSFKIAQIIFENGEHISFQYNNMGFLSKIVNEESGREILSIEYNTGRISISDSLKDNNRVARTYFSHTNGHLTRATIPIDRNVLPPNPNTLPAYTYRYQTFRNGLIAINNLSNPMGGEDVITYRENGHAYANNTFIPNVIQITHRANGGTADMTRQFTFSTHNFTGFPFSGGFAQGQDNLYLVRSEYNYSTTEQILDSNNSVLQSREITFNRFHLKTLETTEKQGRRLIRRYTYNDITGVMFTDQPANLQLPKEILTRFEIRNSSSNREESIRMISDDFGNELSRTEASGIRYESDYFPVGGIAGLCPPEPHGLFTRFKREERIFPSSGNESTRVTQHTYIQIANFRRNANYVLHASSATNGNLTSRLTYLQNFSNIALHGRIQESAATLNSHTTRTQFSYTTNLDRLTESRKIVGYDATFLTSNRTISLINRLVTEVQKEDAVKLVFEYDINEKLVTEIASPNTQNQARRHYEYHFSISGALANMVINDAKGERYITRYDGFGRNLSSSVIKSNGELLLRRRSYNRLGQLISETAYDHISGQELALNSVYSYDGWGELERTIRPDGSVIVNAYDPIQRVRTEGIEGTHYTRTYFNAFDKATRIQQIDSVGGIVDHFNRTFDGFGRCISEVDIDGHRTHFSYDAFDRLVRESYIPADATSAKVIETEFVSHSIEALKTAIKVDGILVGSRAYDGVGRLTKQSRGNAGESTWSYLNGSTQPNSARSPRGIIQNFQYNAQLLSLEQVKLGSVTTSEFDFDRVTGNLIHTSNNEFKRELHFDTYGHLNKDTQLFDNQSHANNYQYSPAGRLITADSALRDKEMRSYDTAGRIEKASVGSVHLTTHYDRFSRISRVDTSAQQGNVITGVTYDEAGRESIRRIEHNGALLQTITTTYHQNGLIASKMLTNAQGIAIIGETYLYDAYRRLITYSCSGPEYSKDQNGRSLQYQAFTYDALNNITQVISQFTDGTEDISTRSFQGRDPTQLTEIRHTNPSKVLHLNYDASGNLLSDGKRNYHYDELERLINVTENESHISRYHYDAEGRQIKQSANANTTVAFHYSENRIIGASQGNNTSRFVRQEENVLARTTSTQGTELYISDSAASIRGALGQSNDIKQTHYSPYGMAIIDSDNLDISLLEQSRPAFNGEKLDPMTQLYHLGNGRRVYSPELMIFLSPDPLSPFSAAGINSYGYCNGDPINFRDPSGLIQMPRWLTWLLIGIGTALTVLTFGYALVGFAAAGATVATVLGVTGGALGIVSSTLAIAAAAMEEVDARAGWDRSDTIQRLSIASLTFGVLSFVSGLGSAGATVRSTYQTARSPTILFSTGSGAERITFSGISSTSVAARMGLFEGLKALANYDSSLGLFARVVGTVAGVASIPLTIFDIANTSHDLATTSPSSSSNLNAEVRSNPFLPAIDTMQGSLASAHEYYTEFDNHVGRIRASAIEEVYSI
ncbi:hypothetical protein PL78_15070 [Yersinia entomophaga]|uniref:Teneurin-like YD-shell domain-containing protein n=1 Tax=Yersinia entomophaga TaxID=935293 RepID=A0ABN4PW28_YERET|nr:RHS repeat-associated core domain-containing protein [Yersinia entomophaga]ANI31135.1 hypothetical protein PL78_15070 [Yersinia entomophaga]OWF86333.1 hypothetical protein B4914_15085 [Yersinia entomophaga]